LNFIKAAKTIRGAFGEYFGKRATKSGQTIADSSAFETFLETRSSHVGQTSLYGYVRTRAGSRFPELFENDDFMVAINIAKWQMWIACLSDLSVYGGGRLLHGSESTADAVDTCIRSSVDRIFERTGVPEEAGDRFEESREKVRKRLIETDWNDVEDGEFAFSASPEALIYWAPIVDDLKELDSEIVRNSVRFRWQEVRRDLRNNMDAQAVMESAAGAQSLAAD